MPVVVNFLIIIIIIIIIVENNIIIIIVIIISIVSIIIAVVVIIVILNSNVTITICSHHLHVVEHTHVQHCVADTVSGPQAKVPLLTIVTLLQQQLH